MPGFDDLEKKYRRIGVTVPARVAVTAAPAIRDSVDSEFASGRDPSGRPWVARKDGRASTLEDTGSLRASLEVTARGTDIDVSFGDKKFAFHQSKRPMLPSGVNAPVAWSDAVGAAYKDAMKETG